MQCLNCKIETKNIKYCSRKCSTISNNKLYPKRKIKKKCANCDSVLKSWRNHLCTSCKQSYLDGQYKNKTIGEYRNLQSVKGKHPSWISSHIRLFARSWFKHLTKLPCAKCGYNHHVELSHIKAVSSFPDTTLLSEVNNLNNIIQLCPNCHWEFDNLPR